MSAPRLNRRMVLETPTRTADASGGYHITWLALGTLWAEVRPTSGRAATGEAVPLSQIRHRIIVRGAPEGSTARPTPGQRLRENNRLFVIAAVTEWDAGGRFLTCFATEETAR